MPMAWRARRTKLPGAVGMPIIDTAVLTGWIMFGRLFKFFLLATVLVLLVRMLFSRQQRHGLREWVTTLAQALLISSALFVATYWLWGVH
jgi:hypothetical protein